MTVQELLETTALRQATLQAGDRGLAHIVERVQWMEVLDDFADYLAPGDLLLTTAYNLRDDPDLQQLLAARMASSGVVAMVVKCGYYLDRIPYPVQRQADEIGLPVFELPREVPFVEISQSVYERLVSRSYARLRRAADVHRELVRLVVEGADLQTMVRRAASLVDGPVVVEDARGRRLAGATPQGRLPPDAVPEGSLGAPVIARGILHGHVRLLGTGPWSDDDSQALEQAATVVALEIARSEHELRAERERAGEFVRELVSGRLDGAAARRTAAVLGVELPEPLDVLRLPPAVAVDTPLAAEEDGETVALLTAGAAGPVGPGGAARAADLEGVPQAYARAGRAWRLGQALRGEGVVHRYEDLETYDALVGHLDGDRLARLRARVTEPLSPQLLETLRAYLDSGASVAAAARATFVHRNTVRYRIGRIEQRTGLDLARLEDRLLCELALLAERVSLPSPTTASGASSRPGASASSER